MGVLVLRRWSCPSGPIALSGIGSACGSCPPVDGKAAEPLPILVNNTDYCQGEAESRWCSYGQKWKREVDGWGLPCVGVGDLAELIQDLLQQREVAGAQVGLPLR